jgi:predicted GIY-YIG superfamily endonuclease
MAKQFYVYILASKPNGTLYTGVTSNLIQRVWQHKKLGLIENSNPEWRDLYKDILG